MHYCITLFTNEQKNESEIISLLESFNERKHKKNIGKKNRIEFDGLQIGGRYAGLIKRKIPPKDNDYGWDMSVLEAFMDSTSLGNGMTFADNTIGLFTFKDANRLSYFGFGEGSIRCDGCPSSDVINIDDIKQTFGFIDQNLKDYQQEEYQKNSKKKAEYDKAFNEAFSKKESFVTILDFHN